MTYNNDKKEYKIVISTATVTTFSRAINIFIGVFNTKEDAELYYNLE